MFKLCTDDLRRRQVCSSASFVAFVWILSTGHNVRATSRGPEDPGSSQPIREHVRGLSNNLESWWYPWILPRSHPMGEHYFLAPDLQVISLYRVGSKPQPRVLCSCSLPQRLRREQGH
jgi:hypothetical protein